jgi:hypothetical protein
MKYGMTGRTRRNKNSRLTFLSKSLSCLQVATCTIHPYKPERSFADAYGNTTLTPMP